MKRYAMLWAALTAVIAICGCPPAPGDGDPNSGGAPTDDPVTPTEPTLNITSNASVLQFNAAALASPQFLRRADLTAVLANATATSITWAVIEFDGSRSFLQFEDEQGNFSDAAEGRQVSVTVIDAPDDDVLHTVQATATLGDDSTITATIVIQVTPDPLGRTDTASFLTVSPFAIPAVGLDENRQVTLDPGISGEVGSVQVTWSPLDPAALPPGVVLPDLEERVITITFPDGANGVFPFICEVQDSEGNLTNAIVNVYIGIVDLFIDATPTRVQINPNATVEIRTLRAGGAPDLDPNDPDAFAYSWQVFDEAGDDITDTVTIAPDASVEHDANVVNWTFTGLNPGAYRFSVAVRDRFGLTAVDTTTVTLSDTLALAVAASRQQLGINQTFSVRATRTGGQENYRYSFAAVDSDGDNAAGLTTLPANGQINNSVTADFGYTGGFTAAGDYRLFVTVTDGAGNSASASTSLTVGDGLSLDVSADKTFAPPGDPDPVNFTFNVNGGVGPYTYSYALSRSPGATGDVTLAPASPQSAGGDFGTQWDVPAAGAGAEGTYRLDVTVTDDIGNTAVDSLPIVVANSGGGLQVDLQAFQAQVAPGTTHNPLFRTRRINGTGPDFEYEFAIFDDSGTDQVGQFGGVLDMTTTDNDAINTWNATLGGGLTPGTYRVEVQLTDTGTGDVAYDSLELLVADILTLDLTPQATLLAPGVPIRVVATANGGLGTYDYTYTSVDQQGIARGSFSSTTDNNVTGASTVVWAPTEDFTGTITITATATDDELGTTVTRSATVHVTREGVVAEVIVNPPAAQLDLSVGAAGLFEAGEDLNALGGATATASFTPDTVAPMSLAYGRSLTFLVTDGGTGNLVINSITFIGTNQRGEVIAVTDNSGTIGTTVEVATGAFRTLEMVTVDYENAEAAVDTLEIGVGQFFGLQEPVRTSSSNATTRSFQLVAAGDALDGTAATAVNATLLSPFVSSNFGRTAGGTPVDRQAVRFEQATPPNGTRDYILQYEPYRAMSVRVEADALAVDVSDGDVVNLVFDVQGGVAPYTYSFADLGSFDPANNTVDNNFNPASAVAGVNGDLATVFTPPGVGASETHVIRVLVTDALGNQAVGSTIITIVP